jgi:hypothetical protein
MAVLHHSLAAVLAAACLTSSLAAQEAAPRGEERALLGLSLTLSGSGRDTLGFLVASVTSGSPADRAGIVQGNRVAEIAGVSLRVDPAEVGQSGVDDRLAGRLATVLRQVQPGDAIPARVFSGTRSKMVQLEIAGDAPAPRIVASAHDSVVAAPPPGPSVRPALAMSPPAPVTPVSEPAVQSVTDALEQQRVLLRRLARTEESDARADSLLHIEQDLRAIVRRLRDLQAPPPDKPPQPVASGPATAAAVDSSTPGLRVMPVGTELQGYFGEGSESGVLVVAADSTWMPLHNGDVILRIDGRSVDAARLHAAYVSTAPVAIELLRQRRRIIVTMHDGG